MAALNELLRCPQTGERLVPATPAELTAARATAGLVNESRTRFYPVENGIPVLLPDEAVDLSHREHGVL